MIMMTIFIIAFAFIGCFFRPGVEASAIAAAEREQEQQVLQPYEETIKELDFEEDSGEIFRVANRSIKSDRLAPLLRRGLQSEICDLDLTIESLTGISSPLFDVGQVNILDLLADQYDSIASAATGLAVLTPRVVCAGADEDGQLSSLGEALGVTACEKIDFVNEVDVFAFGIGQPDGISFCAAFNIDRGTFALGQNNILPDLKVSILTVSLDALGISLTKSLALDTLNQMWDNTGPAEVIQVFGHVVIRGTGEIGFKASDKVRGVIAIDTSIVIDADYNNNGIAPVLADGSTSVDFAMLLSGKAGIILTVTAYDKQTKRIEEKEFDLTTLASLDADVYTVVNGADTAIQLAASISIKLQGICDLASPLDLLCEVFDGNSGISGAIRSYANKGGFGMQFEVNGFIGLKSDFLEDVLGWPDDGLAFSVTFSLGFTGNALYVCGTLKNKKWCWDHCSSDNECEASHFCNIGVCVEDRENGGACFTNSVCKSGYCVAGFCSECPTIDSSTGCENTEFCTQTLAIGYRCKTKLDLGAVCSANNPCKSNYCVRGFCSQCPTLDSSTGCASTEFCAQQWNNVGYRCETKRDLGGACLSDNPCKSGICRAGFCSQCPTIDSSTSCASTEFCTQPLTTPGFRCKTKLDLGGACLSNNVCKSGFCVAGFCSQCPTIDSSTGCASTEFCTQGVSIGYRCSAKRGKGGLCSSNNACLSNKCDVGFCVDCYRDGTGCTSSQFCNLGGCQQKISRGSVCVENRVCASGKCDVGFCVDCYRSGDGCSSSQYCDLGQCKTKLSNGSWCVESRVCMSGKCAWYAKCA